MSNVETLSGLQRRLNASIPQQQLRGEMEARLKHIGRTAKVHGFRPGKVPYKVLEQQYGPSVQQEVLGESLQRSFADAAISQQAASGRLSAVRDQDSRPERAADRIQRDL